MKGYKKILEMRDEFDVIKLTGIRGLKGFLGNAHYLQMYKPTKFKFGSQCLKTKISLERFTHL